MATSKNPLVVSVQQLIRKPVPLVFAAFTQPKELEKFWLSKASAPLEEGKTVLWHFKVRGVKDSVKVLVLEPNQRIRVRWSNGSTTEWTFTALGRNQTLLRVEQAGFSGSGDKAIAEAMETTQGYALVVSDLKVLLEKGIRSGVVKDKAWLIERAMRAAKSKK